MIIDSDGAFGSCDERRLALFESRRARNPCSTPQSITVIDSGATITATCKMNEAGSPFGRTRRGRVGDFHRASRQTRRKPPVDHFNGCVFDRSLEQAGISAVEGLANATQGLGSEEEALRQCYFDFETLSDVAHIRRASY